MAIVTTKSAVMNATTVEKLVTEHSSVQNQKWREAQQKAKVKRVEAKEERAAKEIGCRDPAGHVEGLIWLMSVPQQERVARDFQCQQRGARGGHLHSQDRHRSSGDSGCLEKARKRAMVKAKESQVSAS